MKRFFALLLACWVLCFSVGAVYEVDNDTYFKDIPQLPASVDPVGDISTPTFPLDEVLAALPQSVGNSDVVNDDVVLTGVSRVSISPVTPSSTSGLKAALLTVLGNYDPLVVVYQYNTSSSGYSSYATDIQPDYAWIASAVLLCLVIWSLFKLGGALLRG